MQADLEFVKLINELEEEMANEHLPELSQKILNEINEIQSVPGFHDTIDCSTLNCVREYEMARKPRAKKEAENSKTTKSLIDALKFLKLGQSKNGTEDQTFCQLKNHWAMICTDGLAMGVPIEEDLDACPHTYNLLAALGSCKSELLISQPNRFELNVKSGEFNANVNCLGDFQQELVQYDIADKPIAEIGNSIVSAFKVLGKLVTKTPTNIVFGSVLLQANSTVATDGCALVEFWHGVNLPPNMLIPKIAIDAIVGAKKELKSFGISEYFHPCGSPASITFYFEDGSWIKTALPDSQYINYSPIINIQTEQKSLPIGFMEGVKTLAAFSTDSIITFDESAMRTTNGATFEISGLPNDIAFDYNYLLQFEKIMNTACFDVAAQHVIFYGDGVRGLVKAMEV